MTKAHTGRYVKVNSSGQVEIRLTSGGPPVARFCFNAVLAILTCDLIQVNQNNGPTVSDTLCHNGRVVSAPYLSI
jgi:hypothetical protein